MASADVVYRYIGMLSLLFALLPSIFAAEWTSEDCPLISKRVPKRARSHDQRRDQDDSNPVPRAITVERIISADDFLRWLNGRLRYESCPALRGLSRAECLNQERVVTIHYHGGNGTLRSQEVYDPHYTFMKGEEFTPSDHNHLSTDGIRRGSHKVGFYRLDGERVLCLKENPEVPGLERAARLLYEYLFGADKLGVPNSLTILMNGRVFTASRYVLGEGFDEIIRHVEGGAKKEELAPKEPPVFIENLHKMKVFVILTGPEDGRPQNYIWQVVGNIDGHRVFRVFSIDNERILGNSTPHSSRRDAAIVVRGHSIMHCIPELQPDYRNLKRILSVTTPRDICKNWLAAIREERIYHKSLIPYAKIIRGTCLRLPITGDQVRCLYTRIKSIYAGLERGNTLEEIFMHVNPPLAMVYRTVSDTPVTPPDTAALSDDPTPPRSCLKRAAKRVRAIDSGRAGDSTPPSACAQLFGDYLPSQTLDATLSMDAVLSLPSVSCLLSAQQDGID